MKILKILAIAIGFFAVIFGSNSGDKNVCCTWKDDWGDTYIFCKDYIQWQFYYSTWKEVVETAKHYGGKCK